MRTIEALKADIHSTREYLKRLDDERGHVSTPRDYADIFHAARGLAEIANVASTVPNYPELSELRASWAEMVEQRIADLMEAING